MAMAQFLKMHRDENLNAILDGVPPGNIEFRDEIAARENR
jgi:hypothetical protein